MKLTEIIMEVDIGDRQLAQTVEDRERSRVERTSHARGVWLIDRKTGKKLSGPFKTDDDAVRFKQNRPDKIPSDARVAHL